MATTKRMSVCKMLAAILLLTAVTGGASALTITRNFLGVGAAPVTVGGGNFNTIFNIAADWWEAAILDPFNVTISYDWGVQAAPTLAAHTLLTQAGGRETSGRIIFDNDGSTSWFLDPTPYLNEEWSTFTATTANLGGGIMNVGRVWSNPSGFAVGNFDLLSTAIHEIGHALGLSSANFAFQAEAGAAGPGRDVDVTAPRQFPGSSIPLDDNTAHISLATSLMWPFANLGGRVYISDADILANCQISQFTNCVLNPSIPEPGTLALLALSLGVVGLVVRKKRRA